MLVGIPVFVLPTPAAEILALLLFLGTLLALPRALQWGWIGFALTSVCLGAVLYGLALPEAPTWGYPPFLVGLAAAKTGALAMGKVVGFFSIGVLAGRWIPGREILPYLAHRPSTFYLAGTILRMLPTLREDLRRIEMSQRARGHDLRERWWNPAAYVPLLVPLFVSTLRRAREQAIALHLAAAHGGGEA